MLKLPIRVAAFMLSVPTLVTAAPQAGSLDLSFGDQGMASVQTSSSDQLISGTAMVFVDRFQRTVTLGAVELKKSDDPEIADFLAAPVFARFNSSGAPDASFGNQGIQILPSLAGMQNFLTGHILGGALISDGKILYAGSVNGSAAVHVARLMEDGKFDPTFGKKGVAEINLGDVVYDRYHGLFVRDDGKIYLVTKNTDDFYVDCIRIARLLKDGTLDGSFGKGGLVEFRFRGYNRAILISAALLKNGDLALNGIAGSSIPALAVLSDDGSPNPHFGNHGTVLFESLRYVLWPTPASDGKIIFSSGVKALDGMVIGRLNSDGTLDSSFGMGGIATLPVFLNKDEHVSTRTTAIQSDGSIIVMGNLWRINLEDSDASIQTSVFGKFKSNGTVDKNFGNQGYTIHTPYSDPTTLSFNALPSMAIQSDDKIIAGISYRLIPKLRGRLNVFRFFGK